MYQFYLYSRKFTYKNIIRLLLKNVIFDRSVPNSIITITVIMVLKISNILNIDSFPPLINWSVVRKK